MNAVSGMGGCLSMNAVSGMGGCLSMDVVLGKGGARGRGTEEAQLCSPEEQQVMC